MTLEFDRIQALLFDIDGTLSDTDDHMVAAGQIAQTFQLSFKEKTLIALRWLV